MGDSWPLVGRREELDFVAHALATNRSGGVILAGAAGVGKTRLAQEALSEARSRGVATHWAVATRAAASMPFGAFAYLLPRAIPTGVDRVVVLRQMLDSLAELSQDRLVLAIDDAHLLDAASAVFVHQAALTGKAFIVATMRTGETAPDSIVSLWKDGLAERLEVQTLSQNEVEELVARALGGLLDRRGFYKLWVATGGNPLFIRELILGGIESEVLVEEDLVWRWKGPIAGTPRLMEVIESRLGALQRGESRTLELLAIGEPLGMQIIESLVGAPDIDALERKGLIEVSSDERRINVRVGHPLYAEVLRARIPEGRRRSLERQLAEAQEAQGISRREDVLRIATWRLEAGGKVDAELLTRAARQALAAFDYGLAERLARVASESGGGFESRIILADALRSMGEWEKADELLIQIENDETGSSRRVEASILRAYTLFFGKDSAADAYAVMRQAARALGQNEADYFLGSQRALLSLYEGRPIDAIEHASRVLDNPHSSLDSRLNATMAFASGLAISGKPLAAIETCDRVQPTLDELGPQGSIVSGQFLAVRWLALWLAGSLEEASTLAENAYRLAISQGSHDGMAIMAAAAGQSALARGLVITTEARMREAIALLKERDRNRFLAWAWGVLGHSAALAGDVDAAAASISEGESVRPRAARLFDTELERGQAWLAFARGEIRRGVEISLSAAEMASASGRISFQIQLLHEVARMGQPKRVVRSVSELAGRIEGAWGTSVAAHVIALSEQDPSGLHEASIQFERMGAWLLAAEASAASANAFRKANKIGSAATLRARTIDLLKMCEGARGPAVSLSFELPELTPREQEIVTLVAAGHSSREIAEKLVLSVRTVDNHLHRAYAKLGVTSRRELLGEVSRGKSG